MNSPTESETEPVSRLEVVVIGAGYAGVMAANRLAGHRRAGHRVRVRLLNPSDRFVERIRLHESLTDGTSPTLPLRDLCHAAVEVVVGRAARIDRDASVVELDDGRRLAFDRVVLATGSRTPAPDGTFAIDQLEHLAPLRAALGLSAGRSVADPGTTASGRPDARRRVRVVGGGLTGIEAAGELAHAGFDVELVDANRVGAALGPRAQGSARRTLERLGCRLVDEERVRPATRVRVGASGVAVPDPRDATTARRDEEPVTVWTAGFCADTVPIEPPLPTAPDGRLVVDATLRSPADPRILAAGDCAAPPAAHHRASCAAALPMGAGAADTIAAELAALAPEPVGIGFAMHCVSLGRDASIVEPVRPDDRPFGLAVGARPARWVKDWIMGKTIAWLRDEAARPGSFRGVRGPA